LAHPFCTSHTYLVCDLANAPEPVLRLFYLQNFDDSI